MIHSKTTLKDSNSKTPLLPSVLVQKKTSMKMFSHARQLTTRKHPMSFMFWWKIQETVLVPLIYQQNLSKATNIYLQAIITTPTSSGQKQLRTERQIPLQLLGKFQIKKQKQLAQHQILKSLIMKPANYLKTR